MNWLLIDVLNRVLRRYHVGIKQIASQVIFKLKEAHILNIKM
jgi:hypothetical protein